MDKYKEAAYIISETIKANKRVKSIKITWLCIGSYVHPNVVVRLRKPKEGD